MDFNQIKEDLLEAGFILSDDDIKNIANLSSGLSRVRYCRETFKFSLLESVTIDKIVR